jgi:hypothetical protein
MTSPGTLLTGNIYIGLGLNFSFAELLPVAKIQFLIGDISYLFSSDVGYLYDWGAYQQGRSSGAPILYKTIMYNKFIAYSL